MCLYIDDIFMILTVVDCGTLSNLTYGQVSHTGTSLQQTATYSCNPGYELLGDRTRVCLSTGVWSGSAPTCKRRFLQ